MLKVWRQSADKVIPVNIGMHVHCTIWYIALWKLQVSSVTRVTAYECFWTDVHMGNFYRNTIEAVDYRDTFGCIFLFLPRIIRRSTRWHNDIVSMPSYISSLPTLNMLRIHDFQVHRPLICTSYKWVIIWYLASNYKLLICCQTRPV